MVERPKLVFDVVEITSIEPGIKEVKLEGTVPKLIPDILAGNRARAKAITAAGFVDTSAEIVEELSRGNLGRITDVISVEKLEDRPATRLMRYTIIVGDL